MGLVLLLAAVLVGAAIGLWHGQCSGAAARPRPSLLRGVLFAAALGVIQFAGQGARNDITKLIADTAGEGVTVVDDEGRIIYANESYVALAGSQSGDVRTVERLFTGAPEVSEAIYRLAQAAREQRYGRRKYASRRH